LTSLAGGDVFSFNDRECDHGLKAAWVVPCSAGDSEDEAGGGAAGVEVATKVRDAIAG
jgi:hypothetical protein